MSLLKLIVAVVGIVMTNLGIIPAISAHKAGNLDDRNRAILQVVTGVVLIVASQLV